MLVGAVVGGRSDFESWPSPPPISDNLFADCVGIVNDAHEFTLCLSEHVLETLVFVLTDDEHGFGWDPAEAENYVGVLWDIAEKAGGGVYEAKHEVTDCSDYEDNRILELALDAKADLIVSSDAHLLDMSPWREIPIITPQDFARRTDVMRRQARRTGGGA